MDSLSKQVGNRILMTRRSKGWNQGKLAEMTGLSRGQLSKYEHGGTIDIRASNLIRLADALGVSVDWLLGRDNNA